MRVVFVANWWYRRGGLGAVMLDEASALERRGHEIIPFAASHPDNLPTPWARYFPEFHETADMGGLPWVRWSRDTGNQATVSV